MKLRCAIYARYSSDRQSPTSITDQVRKCRQYAEAHGWDVLKNQVYSDEAVSGTTSEREGLKRLMAAAEAKAFDVVLIDDTSRLSRHLSDALSLTERLVFAGVRVIFVSQSIDTESEQARLLLATHGIVDDLYIGELAKKVFRRAEGLVLDKMHHGGRIFGYRNVPIEDPNKRDRYGRAKIEGARLAVDEQQAKIVRRIFSMYAAGLSIKALAKKLNAEQIPSPQPRKGREQSWAPSSIRVILHNERYRGVVVWAKTKKIRNPATSKRVRRPRPKSEWVSVEMPEQRIVPEKLWLAVRERLAFVNRVYGSAGRKGGLMNRGAYSRYLFSGLLRCGLCGANFGIVSGAGQNSKGYKRGASYGCPSHALRGTCTNARRISQDTLETELLAKLQRDVLSDAAIDYCLEKLEQEIEKRHAALGGEMEEMRRRKAELEAKIKNLTRAIEDGMDSPAVRAAITEREAEISAITAKTLGTKKGSVHEKMLCLRKFVKQSLGDIRELIAGKHGNIPAVRQELARHIDAITFYPKGSSIRYKGGWKLLGGRECAEGQS